MSSNTYGRPGTVIIVRGDDIVRLAGLERAEQSARARLDECRKKAKDAERRGGLTLDEADDEADELAAAEAKWSEAAAAADEFAAEADERAAVVVMHSLGRRKWRELMADHKPRPDEKADEMFGVNMDTLPDVLLPLSIDVAASSNIDGPLDDFLDSLSDYDYYDRLFVAAFSLNRGQAAADPKARLLSAQPRTTPATSN